MRDCLLLLGADLGAPAAQLAQAEERIAQRTGTVLARSRDHWTTPWGFAGEQNFLNRALLLRTELPPEDLMTVLLEIERDLGRRREKERGYASRTIDIDILLYDDLMLRTDVLEVPHRLMHQREFALSPAADVAPGMVHPGAKCSVIDLLGDLRHQVGSHAHTDART